MYFARKSGGGDGRRWRAVTAVTARLTAVTGGLHSVVSFRLPRRINESKKKTKKKTKKTKKNKASAYHTWSILPRSEFFDCAATTQKIQMLITRRPPQEQNERQARRAFSPSPPISHARRSLSLSLSTKIHIDLEPRLEKWNNRSKPRAIDDTPPPRNGAVSSAIKTFGSLPTSCMSPCALSGTCVRGEAIERSYRDLEA